MPDPAASSILQHAQRVLDTEAAALAKLATQLPPDFQAATEAMLACQGRVIVSGVGKSGHIGRKIAATFASTGTPSYFIHATEASHGDLGMIGPQDLCLLISNSGETAELKDMIAHTRRFSIPMAAISSNGASTLSKAATFKLTLPDAPEACPIGLAPTTSTTLALALGDALAVALMQQRNFRAENFQTFHPGGKLGAQMMRTGQLMHGPEKLPIVSAKSSMADTLLEMTSKGFGVAALIENDRLTGLISDGDLRRHMQGLMDKTAADIASPTPITIAKDDFAADALRIMNTHKISVLIVVDDAGIACGILHIHDLLRAGVA